jgi:L-rhamnose mutarotase
MLRHAFTMKLRPGAYAEYKHLHDTIWPELVEEIEQCGVLSMSIFEAGPELLFLYSEVRDAETWTRLRDSEVHQRWGSALRHLFVLNEAGEPDLGELNEIFTLGRAARGEGAESAS